MFTTTDPNDWQLIHVQKRDTCKFAATLLHKPGSARTTVFTRIACLDLNDTLFGYGLRLSPRAKQAAACVHDVIIVVLYGIIPYREKMDDVQNSFFLSGQSRPEITYTAYFMGNTIAF